MKRVSVLVACALPIVASAAHPTPATLHGRFFGTLPAAACVSQDVLLALHADGHYVLQAHCQDDLQATPIRRGDWSVTWNGTCVRLTSEHGDDRALEFAIHDDDLLVLTAGSCVEPVEDPRGRTLRRATEDRGRD